MYVYTGNMLMYNKIGAARTRERSTELECVRFTDLINRVSTTSKKISLWAKSSCVYLLSSV